MLFKHKLDHQTFGSRPQPIAHFDRLIQSWPWATACRVCKGLALLTSTLLECQTQHRRSAKMNARPVLGAPPRARRSRSTRTTTTCRKGYGMCPFGAYCALTYTCATSLAAFIVARRTTNGFSTLRIGSRNGSKSRVSTMTSTVLEGLTRVRPSILKRGLGIP